MYLFTVHVGSGLSPPSCGVFLPPPLLQAFPFTSFPAPDCWVCAAAPASQCVYFTTHVGGGSSPLSCGVFLPLPLSQAFPLLVAGCAPLLPLEPLRPGPTCLFTVLGRSPLPPLWRSGSPTLFAMCLYCSYWLLLSFSLFPRWGLVCPGGYAVLAQGCLWRYHTPLNSPCPCLPKPSGHGRLGAWGPSWFLPLM
jgi:hypothetical protein